MSHRSKAVDLRSNRSDLRSKDRSGSVVTGDEMTESDNLSMRHEER